MQFFLHFSTKKWFSIYYQYSFICFGGFSGWKGHRSLTIWNIIANKQTNESLFYLIVPVCCSLNTLLGTRVFLLILNRFVFGKFKLPEPIDIMLLQIFKRVPKSVKIVFQINYIFEKHFHTVVISISKRLIIISQVKHLYFR